MRRYARVAVGGTFDRFHIGHEALLATAFRRGLQVTIGLTSPSFLSAHPKPAGRSIASEAARRRRLVRWLGLRYRSRRWSIVPLQDRFGGAVEDGIDALVVSVDTMAGGRAINRERARLGRRPLRLLVVPVVLADDLEPVRSTRIRSGEIDRSGHRRGPITVGLSIPGEADRRAAVRGIRRAFPRARVEVVGRRAGERVSAAALRQDARRAARRHDLGIAVARTRPGGWLVAVQGRRAALDPRRLGGRSSRELQGGLARLLRPAPPKRL